MRLSRFPFRARLALCACVAAAAFCSGAATASPLVRFAAPVTEHVYVQDPGASTLFMFPVINGVIAGQPDATLATPLYASGVTVAPDGTIYVSDSAGQRILIYRAGAHGNERPRHAIRVPTTPYELALESNGFLFARLTNSAGTSEIAVISPQRRVVNLINESAASSVAVDSSGNLYDGFDTGFHVFATPDTNPTLIHSTCLGTVYLALAPGGRLFVSRGTTITRVEDTLNACPVPKGRFEIRAVVSPGLDLPYLAVDGKHLFTVEPYNKRVLQLDPDNGNPQTPIANIQLPAFSHPYAIAVGP